MNLRISTDIGGTFTDLVCVDEKGDLSVEKVPTTSERVAEGIFNALNLLSNQYGNTPRDVLKQCDTFIHGSTVATNAMISRTTAKIGLILTKGHRDIPLSEKGGRKMLLTCVSITLNRMSLGT
jgi:N-methylhydantoinase A